ncbi:MAG: hypothetical protein LBR34_11765 [Prevotella sp.]|jgi:hypothetical protein|nr:hypothetical protein [Prevotella sp.]
MPLHEVDFKINLLAKLDSLEKMLAGLDRANASHCCDKVLPCRNYPDRFNLSK